MDGLVLVALALVLFLFRANSLPLMDPDESRCAMIVREMTRGGDWLVPHLNGEAYCDKPAVFFWLAAAGQWVTGQVELGGRLVSALAGCLCVLVTYAYAKRLGGRAAGLFAGIALATSAEFLFVARWYRMDMPFVAAMWAALWWYARREQPGPGIPQGGAARRGQVGFYAFCGIAVLFKGPAGLALPLGVLVVWLGLRREARRLLGLLHPAGLAVFLAVAAPWYVAVMLRDPGYAYEFFIRQNVLRYTGGGELGHHWPGILYVPVLLAGLLPWAVFLPGVIWRYWPRRLQQCREQPHVLLLWLAAVVPVVFFAFSSTKLVQYILPSFPPLAVLVGVLLVDWAKSPQPDRLMKHGLRALAVAILLASLIPAGTAIFCGAPNDWTILPVPAAAAALVVMRTQARRDHRAGALAAAAAGLVVVWVSVIAMVDPVYERFSARTAARAVPAAAARAGHLFYWTSEALSFQFYTDSALPPRFHLERTQALLDWIKAHEPAYGLVSGADRLQALRAIEGISYHVEPMGGDRWLLRVQTTPTPTTSPTTAPASAPARTNP